MSFDEFMMYTPFMLVQRYETYQRKERESFNNALTIAYMNAGMQRSKRMPKLDDIIIKEQQQEVQTNKTQLEKDYEIMQQLERLMEIQNGGG